MAAEEWGIADSKYDWSTGAYAEVFNVHPEWAGKVIGDFNFELPALSNGNLDGIRCTYEIQKTFFEDTLKDTAGTFTGLSGRGSCISTD